VSTLKQNLLWRLGFNDVNSVNSVYVHLQNALNLTHVANPWFNDNQPTTQTADRLVPGSYSQIIKCHDKFARARVMTSRVTVRFDLATSFSTCSTLRCGILLLKADPITIPQSLRWEDIKHSKDMVFKTLKRRHPETPGHCTVELFVNTAACQSAVTNEDASVFELPQLAELEQVPEGARIETLRNLKPISDRVFAVPFVCPIVTQDSSGGIQNPNEDWSVNVQCKVSSAIKYSQPRTYTFSIASENRILPGWGPSTHTDGNSFLDTALPFQATNQRVVQQDLVDAEMKEDAEDLAEMQTLEDLIALQVGSLSSVVDNNTAQISSNYQDLINHAEEKKHGPI